MNILYKLFVLQQRESVIMQLCLNYIRKWQLTRSRQMIDKHGSRRQRKKVCQALNKKLNASVREVDEALLLPSVFVVAAW